MVINNKLIKHFFLDKSDSSYKSFLHCIEYTMNKFTGKLQKKLKDKGITAKEFPKAIVIHELMGYAMLAMTWSFCYFFPLSKQKFLQKPIKVIMSKMPKGFRRTIAKNNLINSRLGTAYIESSCLRKLIRPFTLPAKILLTIKIVEWTLRYSQPKVSLSSPSMEPIVSQKSSSPSPVGLVALNTKHSSSSDNYIFADDLQSSDSCLFGKSNSKWF
jgi:hypothetical protein